MDLRHLLCCIFNQKTFELYLKYGCYKILAGKYIGSSARKNHSVSPAKLCVCELFLDEYFRSQTAYEKEMIKNEVKIPNLFWRMRGCKCKSFVSPENKSKNNYLKIGLPPQVTREKHLAADLLKQYSKV